MFIRILNFQIQKNKKTEVVTIMDNIVPKIRSLEGCKSDDHYALLVFWNSRKDADAAASFIGPQLIPALNRISKENVTPRLYEVYQPEVLQEQR